MELSMHLPFSQGGLHVTVKKNKAQKGAIFVEKYKYRHGKVTFICWFHKFWIYLKWLYLKAKMLLLSNLVPRAFSWFKMEDRRNPWQGCWTARNVEFFVTRHMMTGFTEVVSSVWRPCLFSCNLKPLFKRNEHILSCLGDKILTNLLKPFWQPWPGVSPIRHFEWGEGPGDEFDCCL